MAASVPINVQERVRENIAAYPSHHCPTCWALVPFSLIMENTDHGFEHFNPSPTDRLTLLKRNKTTDLATGLINSYPKSVLLKLL